MLQYVFKRLLGALPTLLIIVTLAFFLVRLAPGGPFDRERPVPPEIAANLDRAYHLDQPLPVQYGYYLLNVARGDFGPSFKYKDHSVNELIAAGFPISMQLGVTAMLLALLLGIPAGMLAALKQNQPLDHAVMALAMTGVTIPNFVMAPLLALVFGVFLRWLPVAGWDQGWKSAVLPVVALALPQVAYAARMMRASMLETLNSPHIRTAFAKGLPLGLILRRHVLKGALLPVISWLGPATAAIITGSVVIEQIFGIPGIGRHFVQGALNRDYTLVMGVVVFYGALIIAMNLLVDVVYGLLDPRVRYE
ncbi:oligopeptide ABC transporter permease OppB [Candidatus Thiothrix sp. Deng01]|uniref:Oligopeptide ABC transporter permease OppB n=1 Tax=Candidatus Thiothrix phosphatis TaxID=3112415 RepID=A0ABU6D0I6_9GAMM|nr:oligopeptide ABC transporter permease OppB [Candidatus Thiothrix sp. Deng01]MEB4592584.1 oligopeptide ABC transporter permease OppB [Candidatus Thiothrix sp. Deng01]